MNKSKETIKSNKRNIRKSIIAKRDLKKEENSLKDSKIFKNLISLNSYKRAKKIFIYIGFGSEINTKSLIEIMLREGKEVFVPKVLEEEMIALKITSLNNLIESKFKILEPIGEKSDIDGEEFDLIIMPGVAFDRSGNRIGYGKGYYDKYLKDIKSDIKKIALAYELQLIEEIETEEHDLKVDSIITENEIIDI
ncbi:5-formyltetrahydrofolate cyclo-ligase [Clostridium sp. LY3-2]|uniref:5-formyltetrahydrofolate cyclo-ligase n=1 Tax=Clostridium sp. LY3-2 TaxID=2942482 RepID=UPI0021528D0A|nr:5-formyltetrahydrofolate cyclo-ligase [Clostridium sp. LY3-2]MCR6514760.1 5-formyltetrahydrofolate cyclo-ligase [Clostridium sp. LY3-2]